MTTNICVAITGYAGAGKDTAAEALTELGFVRRGFADKLKAIALDIDPIVAVDEDWAAAVYLSDYTTLDVAKRESSDGRNFLVGLGRAMRKHVGEDFWADLLMDSVYDENVEEPLVVSDLRYSNEADILRLNIEHVLVIKVVRPGVEAANEEERSVDAIEARVTINNDSDIDALKLCVKAIVLQWMAVEGLLPEQPAAVVEEQLTIPGMEHLGDSSLAVVKTPDYNDIDENLRTFPDGSPTYEEPLSDEEDSEPAAIDLVDVYVALRDLVAALGDQLF